MDSEEGLPHGNDDGGPHQNDCIENDIKEEAKGMCLKIAGQDGYIFKSYSITPQTMDPKPGSRLSDTLVKELSLVSSSKMTSEDKVSQVNEQESEPSVKSTQPCTGHSCDQEGSSSSRDSTNIETSSETEKSSKPPECKNSEHIIDEDKNAMNDGIQEDEILTFDNSLGHFPTRDNEDYNHFLSGTLYDVAMDAVTQSLLSSMRNAVNPRKKSPAWNHFFISPRDGTKAICMYCLKEFSRGKNEKDLSTSCLMRHVRRAHPAALLQDSDITSGTLSSSVSTSHLSPLNSPNKRELPSKASATIQNSTSMSAPSPDSMEVTPKEVLPVTPKLKKHTKNDSTDPSPHSSNSHSEDSVDGLSDSVRGAPKHSNSRRRSAVWKHFYLSPADSSKAVCIHCMNEFSRGKNGKDLGTSCLIRHLWRAHRDVVVEENSRGSNIPPPYTTPPTLLSRFSAQDSGEVKHALSASSSPETISDEMPLNFTENMDVKEDLDDVPYQSEQESLNDASAMSKCNKDLPLGSSPDEISEGPSLVQNLTSVFQENKKIMKRVKSEVWHHFIVSPVDQLKALCRYCPCTISRGKRGDFGTSCLMRHLVRRHPNVLKDQNGTSNKVSPPHSPYSSLAAAETLSNVSVDPAEKKPALPAFTKKTSKLWNHFSIYAADPTKVVCLHCNRTISRGKKTTNLGTSCLFRHMQRFHEHVLESNGSISGVVSSATIKVKQEVMDTSSSEENGRFDEYHPVAKKITKLVAEMLALDLQPSALVENLGLNRLLEYLQPQYSLPPSSYFAGTAIPEMYERVKEVVFTHMKEAESEIIHFTTSIWVSSQTREYLTLTAHWVSYDSCVRPQGQDFHSSALLCVSQMDCDCNVLNVQKQLEYLWDTWVGSSGLKIGFVVTDNPSLGNALEDSSHVTVQCFGHAIDQIISEALKSQRMVQNLLSIARKICERIHRSAKAKEKLAELQRVHHLPENQLVQDIPSKWKTSLYMLERLIEQKKAIDEMSVECNFRDLISCDQWEVVQSICNTLKPFEVACREMSNRTATLGQVIPLIHILNRKIDMLFDETMGIDNMLKSLKEAMVSRMSSTLHDARYMWATMLDPRYKTSLFTEEEAEQCKQDLIQELEGLLPTSSETKDFLSNGCSDISPSSMDTQSNKDNLWALMDDIRNRIKQEEQRKSPELAVLEYLEEEILDQSCDPLDYWNVKKLLWPDLARVAVRYVGCPPSVIAAESLLSTASMNFSLNQSRPLLEDLEKLMFLKVNLPLIYFQY